MLRLSGPCLRAVAASHSPQTATRLISSAAVRSLGNEFAHSGDRAPSHAATRHAWHPAALHSHGGRSQVVFAVRRSVGLRARAKPNSGEPEHVRGSRKMYALTTRCASVSEHPPRHPSPASTLLIAPCSYSAGRPSTHGLFWLLTAVGGTVGLAT
jgi:hypothetical protein